MPEGQGGEISLLYLLLLLNSSALEHVYDDVRVIIKVLIANGKCNTVHAARRGIDPLVPAAGWRSMMDKTPRLSVGQTQQMEKISHVIAVDLSLANVRP
jgi:hypothetical protein